MASEIISNSISISMSNSNSNSISISISIFLIVSDASNAIEKSYVFQNYFGIGVDAELVSRFHENREKEKGIRSSTQIRNMIL